jgi:UV DNA damage endonuclease
MNFQNPIIRQHLRLGLCCLNTTLRSQNIFCSRTCIRKNFTIQNAQEKTLLNLRDLKTMIEWNQQHGITCFRISSDLFPHFTDDVVESYTIDFARPLLHEIGDLIKQYGHRIIMHPGQFNQVGTPNPSVLKKTIADLQHHAQILDAMEINHDGILIVHGGGTYQDKEKTIERWIKQFKTLPETVQRRLVIENDEKSYSTQDCLKIANACHIPMVFDFHHYECWKYPQKTINQLIPDILETWGERTVVMHVSEQAPTRRLGAHSDYVNIIPSQIFETILNFQIPIDLEIEAKMKEQAVLRLYDVYQFNLRPKIKIKIRQITCIGPN